eukprot:SAG31_NODE_1136_length_9734_cov_4.139595_9_plen_247_part_00
MNFAHRWSVNKDAPIKSGWGLFGGKKEKEKPVVAAPPRKVFGIALVKTEPHLLDSALGVPVVLTALLARIEACVAADAGSLLCIFPPATGKKLYGEIKKHKSNLETAARAGAAALRAEINSLNATEASQQLLAWLQSLPEQGLLGNEQVVKDCIKIGKGIGRQAFESREQLEDFIQMIRALTYGEKAWNEVFRNHQLSIAAQIWFNCCDLSVGCGLPVNAGGLDGSRALCTSAVLWRRGRISVRLR